MTIEAVFENLTVGQEVLAGLEADAVIATNTSYLDIDRMSERLSRPERILGLHLLSAADAMKLR